jgi:small subunit ribosomal protein S27Ae
VRKLKHKAVKVNKLFKVSGDKVEKVGKLCPRCGDGTFMAKHKDRYYCGRCHYTEFLSEPKKSPEPKKPSENKKSS